MSSVDLRTEQLSSIDSLHLFDSVDHDLDGTGNDALRRTGSLSCSRDTFYCRIPTRISLSVVVLGASGDLAKKKTYPALFSLFKGRFLPEHFQIVGYARSAMDEAKLQEQLKPFLKGREEEVAAFLSHCHYVQGEYDPGSPGYTNLNKQLLLLEGSDHSCSPCVGRMFYLALPPYVYPKVCTALRQSCTTLPENRHHRSWVRIIVEKPFGRDLESSEELAGQLGELFPEEQLWRIDHYLGKELAQNMMVLRFCNPIFSTWWNRLYVDNVQITFKEPFGTEGRGGYFDKYGIIRDVIQNHLTQVLALLCMEQPVSPHPDDIRDEKFKVLRCIPPVKPDECVLGQYTGGDGQPGYLDDPTVPKDSRCPTFACLKLHINNDRWAGVPFILKAGKALNERQLVVRMQLKSVPVPYMGKAWLNEMRNEFVIRFQPGEAIYAKIVVKKPGLEMDTNMSELDLSYLDRYHDLHIPDAYERLILDCIRGDQQHFVRRDELRASWAIYTPLLHAIDDGTVPLHPYPAGSRGPPVADEFVQAAGYLPTHKYVWRPPRSRQ